jgi:hypothetical protein
MKLTIGEAAKIMDVSPQFLRLSLQQGCFPFGVATKKRQWSYYINAKRFYAYMEAQDYYTSAGQL